MRVQLRARFDPRTVDGADNIRLALALEGHASVTVVADQLGPDLPAPFQRLLDADTRAPHDALLYVGDPATFPPGDGPSVVYVRPETDYRPVDEWDRVVVTNPDRADQVPAPRPAVVPLGVETGPFEQISRHESRLLIVGEHEQAATYRNDIRGRTPNLPADAITIADLHGWRGPDRRTLYNRHTGLLVTNPRYTRYAVEFAATGGCVAAPPVGELGNLVGPDWAVPLRPGDQQHAATVAAGMLRDRSATTRKGIAAAGYVRAALSWSHTGERLVMLTRGVLR